VHPNYQILLPRDATQSAIMRSYVVCPSVRLSVCVCVTFRYILGDHIGWNSSKIISRPNSLRPWLWGHPTSPRPAGHLVQREQPQNWGSIGLGSLCRAKKPCNISETVRDTTKVTITD